MLSGVETHSGCDSVIPADEFTATRWPHRWHLVERVLFCQLIESAASQVEMDLPWDIWYISSSALPKDAWPHIDVLFSAQFSSVLSLPLPRYFNYSWVFNQALRVSGIKLQVDILNGTNGRQRDSRESSANTAMSFLLLHRQGRKLLNMNFYWVCNFTRHLRQHEQLDSLSSKTLREKKCCFP